MSGESVRDSIVRYMKENQAARRDGYFSTWWFKFEIPFETKTIRAELEKMESQGLVESDRSQSNNTKWRLCT